MVKKFFIIVIIILLAVNIARLSFNADARFLMVEDFIELVADFNDNWLSLIEALNGVRNAFRNSSGTFTEGFFDVFTAVLPSLLNLVVEILNLLISMINFVLQLLGFPTLTTFDEPAYVPGGGGGAR